MRDLQEQEVYKNELRRQAQLNRENSSAAGGVALGIAIASLVGAGIAAYALLNRQPESQVPHQNTVIERTKEIVPAPQPKAPDVKAPNINITVPNPAPVKTAPDAGSPQSNSNAQSPSGSDSSNGSSSNSSNGQLSQGGSSTSSPTTAPAENP